MMVLNQKNTDAMHIKGRKLGLPRKKSSIAVLALISTVTIVGTASIAGSIFMGGAGKTSAVRKIAPVATVTLQTAQLGTIPDVLELTGSISASDPLSIGSSAS